MPQVPYQPVPDVRPSGQPTPTLGISTPPAAFGTTVAQAVESVGGQLDKVGNELYTRAVAMQDLQNRTEADGLYAGLIKDVGISHEKYKEKLQGAAVQGLQPHLDELENIRQRYVDQASNPMVKKLFDSESRNLIARTTISAAGHAGAQFKQQQTETAKAVMQNNRIGAATNPNDDVGFQRSLNAVDEHVATQAGAAGWGPEQTAHEVFKERSHSPQLSWA